MQRLCRRQCSGYETVLGSSLLHPMQRGILTTAGLAGTDTSGDSNDAAATEKCDYNLKLLIEGHPTMPRIQTTEDRRLEEARIRKKHWKRWGPYLSERQWGTVREDYSPGGTAWEFFRTITLARAPIAGGRTESEGSATGTRSCALRWPSGMG